MQFRKLIYFILLLIAISWVLDKAAFFGLNYIGKKVHTGAGYGKFQQYKSLKDNLDVVILGNSRANHHVDPSFFKGQGFNLGTHMRKIGYSAAAMLMLPPEKEQLVLIQIDPFNAVLSSYNSEDIDMLLPHYFNDSIIKQQFDNYFTTNRLMHFFWCISLNGNVLPIVKNYLAPSYNPKKYNGFEGLAIPAGEHVLDSTSSEEDCPPFPVLNPRFKRHLQDIVDFGRLNNKRIVFFTAPSLMDLCKTDNQLLAKEMLAINANYLDFSTVERFDNNPDYWMDSVHMSGAGAKEFSDSLSSIIYKKYALN